RDDVAAVFFLAQPSLDRPTGTLRSSGPRTLPPRLERVDPEDRLQRILVRREPSAARREVLDPPRAVTPRAPAVAERNAGRRDPLGPIRAAQSEGEPVVPRRRGRHLHAPRP